MSGTAYAGGNWGTAKGGKTLTGELGEEIVVDPHTGKWYTVGSRGAEFVNIPKGAIVFNHKQTESLLKNGYVAGRASALVGGTAMVTGGISVKNATNSKSSSKSSSKSKKNTTSKSKNSSSNDLEVFDWIEIAIDRIERAVDRLKNTAESAYKSLKTKLGASVDEISKVNQEIALQQQAYNRYMKEANAVGLSSSLKTKVQNGTVDINKYNESTQKQIKDFENWYEKALSCKDAVDELKESLASLYEDNFNNVKDDFENQLSLIEHTVNQYQNGADLLGAKGYLESTKYYAAMQSVAKSNINTLNEELNSLTEQFSNAMNSGEIEKYSESWFQMQDSICSVKEEIAETNIELAEYAKTMREIEWGYFDFVQERIEQLTQESDFLIDLMSNSDLYTDKGQFTNEGMATMGLHAQNFNVYMAQSDKYAEELANINARLANDPNNIELIERREELLKLQQDSILAAEDEKQAIVSLVEDGINKELDSLKELIDEYNEATDSAKDLYDFQCKVEQQAQNIASLQKQISAYENDLSEETRSTVQKLTVELTKAEDELAETEWEQQISEQKKMLDTLYEEYSLLLNQRLDNVDALIGDMITAVNDNTGLINDTLIATADNVGYTMSANMQNIWNGATDALDGTISKYGDGFNTHLTSIQVVLGNIQANTASMIAASNKESNTIVQNTKSETTPKKPVSPTPTVPVKSTVPTTSTAMAKTISVGGKINAGSAKIYDYAGDTSGEKQSYSKDPIYTVLEEKNGYLKVRHHKLSNGVTGWFKKSDVKAYKTGGLVDYTGLAQLDGTPGKPELVLNSKDTDNFIGLRDALRAMASQPLTMGKSYSGFAPAFSGLIDISSKVSELTTPTISQNNNITFGDILIDHVEDYNDFVTQMQKDPKFERMIRAMTTDILGGGSRLAKHNIHWK